MKKTTPYAEDTAEASASVRYATLPVHEQVVDRLADLLFAADELLEIVRAEDARLNFAWVEPPIQGVYDIVNAVMKKLCD